MLSEISQTDRQISYDLSCMKSIYTEKTKLIETEDRLMIAIGRDGGWGVVMDKGCQWVKIPVLNKFWNSNIQHGDFR